jgi:translation initiation factor 4B
MALSDFLNDDSLGGGSWADDELDFNTISVPTTKNFGQTGIATGGANPLDPAFGGTSGLKRDFAEYPIPDAPPYRARMNNLPWDASEQSITEWVEDSLAAQGAVLNLSAPRDMNDSSRLRGFAFITLDTREQLEEILKFSGSDMNGRRVYVAVAAPEKEGFGSRRREDVELDWGSARGSGSLPPREDFGRERRPRREEPNLDWGSARGTGTLPPREDRGEFRERRPRREEPNLDWGSARGTGTLPPREDRGEFRERKPKREEPDFDWSSARGSATLPPRENTRGEFKERQPKKDEPELDWGSARASARASGDLPSRERKPKRQEPNLDWSRGQSLPARSAQKPAASPKEDVPAAKPITKKSAFAVLADEHDDDDEDDDEDTQEEKKEAEEQLAGKTQQLSVKDDESWSTVGKK